MSPVLCVEPMSNYSVGRGGHPEFEIPRITVRCIKLENVLWVVGRVLKALKSNIDISGCADTKTEEDYYIEKGLLCSVLGSLTGVQITRKFVIYRSLEPVREKWLPYIRFC